ncbi:hypothetical protein TPENAI_60284 [Tenacibaculum litopenaei]|jgi:hypothetical protein
MITNPTLIIQQEEVQECRGTPKKGELIRDFNIENNGNN